jgi:hypothetical protein
MTQMNEAKNLIAGQFFMGPPLINRAGVCQRLIQRALTTSRAAKPPQRYVMEPFESRAAINVAAIFGRGMADHLLNRFSPRAAMATRLSFPAARQFVGCLPRRRTLSKKSKMIYAAF